jgi:fimbrial chaperone protein
MKPIVFLATVALVLELGSSSSAAYKLVPISRVFAPSGSEATQSFEVINDGGERIALTISFATLERDQDYVESGHDADEQFLVYPPQMILPPGAHQTVRVTWLGAPMPARELGYRIIVQQVPIALLDPARAPDTSSGRMQIHLTYRGSLLIRPPHAAPSIAVDSAMSVNRNGSTVLALVLRNSGTALGVIGSCSVRMEPLAGAFVDVPASVTAALAGTRILAGGTRRYLLAWPAAPLPGSPGPVKASGRCAASL